MTVDELLMNPFVDVHVHPEPASLPLDIAAIEVITVRCPVRGRGLIVRELGRDTDPALFAFFAALAAADGEADLDSDADIVPDLVDLGFLVTETDVVEHPRYVVPLPDPVAAVPGGVVAASLLYQPEFATHPALDWPSDYVDQDSRMAAFASGPAVWVDGPDGVASPYWLPPALASAAATLVPGAPAPELPADVAGRFAAAGVIVPPTSTPTARDASRDAYAADGVAVVRGFVPAPELRALTAYYRDLLDAGLIPFGDRQNARRHSLYNDPIGRFLHTRYAGAFADVTGEDLRPSFCYFFAYAAGADLAAHKDRPQAEFSISLQLEHRPASGSGGRTGWPLRFRFDDGRTYAADLAPGDAVLYHGRDVTHFRDALPEGQSSALLVLEYVRSDFTGLLI